jgi:predicted DNA-binding transcriptional regulator YafY
MVVVDWAIWNSRERIGRAADIAQALKVSRWTIYRDIRNLMVSGVPIDGEAGTGYILRPRFDLPPLMFNERDRAALLAARWSTTPKAPRASKQRRMPSRPGCRP